MRIRERRRAIGLLGRELGDRIGRSVQQVHKYELGQDGVSAGLLYEIALVLRTSPDYFFEGLDTDHPVTQETPLQRIMSDLMCSLAELQSEEHLEAIGHLVRGLTTKPGLKKRRAARDPKATAKAASRPGRR
jgi:transcriptional regulator with XRE-family HTH domain